MSESPDNLKYLASHEWIKLEDDGTVTVGISDYAQDLLGDIVFVELPEIGQKLEPEKEAAVVESVKAASDIMELESHVTTIFSEIAKADR